MKHSETYNPKRSVCLTRRVIELHARGYHFDYLLAGDQQLLCVQNNQVIPLFAVDITVIDRVYDQLSHSFKYVHTIDTGTGEMGVMVTDSIFTKQAAVRNPVSPR